MKKITLRAGLLMAAGLLSMAVHAQKQPKQFKSAQLQPCGTSEYMQKAEQGQNSANAAQFESWISQKIAAEKARRLAANDNDDQIFTIPVVVHIIHNGDALGVDENISETQVLSQLEVLNQDYRRMAGTPGFNDNEVGADMQMQFCLAKRTPDGQNTTGIVRHNIEHENGGWSMEDADENLKPSTQWDPEQYLNIWVVERIYIEISGFQAELGGYATFPEQSGLDGLDELGPANREGVVVGHRYFGSKAIFAEGRYDETETRDRGRSTTHEIGHYFGLRHIWGDGDCDVDDYCEDTPVAAAANQECTPIDSCPEHEGMDMIENYMDYTPDACMNTFTQDQKARMQAVLQNSPRRVNLLTSLACTPAEVHANDGMLNITQINLADCSNTFAPEVRLTNAGSATLTSATITYSLGTATIGQYNWTGSLDADASATITLPEITGAGGFNLFNVSIATVNGTTDAYAENDTKTTGFTIVQSVATSSVVVTIQPDSYGSETVWAIVDADSQPIATGGPYEDSEEENELGELVTQTVALENGQCYRFLIYDFASDGMCCEYGEGYYRLADTNGNVFAEGASFELYEIVPFGINTTLNNPVFTNPANGIVLYPNPANTTLHIASPKNGALAENYTVYNSLGQVVANGNITAQDQEVNVSGFAQGVYFIKVNASGSSQTLQFVKN